MCEGRTFAFCGICRTGIEDPRNLILITGYQAPNTLGSKLVARAQEVNIFGEPMRVPAQGRVDRRDR